MKNPNRKERRAMLSKRGEYGRRILWIRMINGRELQFHATKGIRSYMKKK